MISEHLPALVVVLPLLGAPLCLVLRRGAPAWGLTLAVSWLCCAGAIALLDGVLSEGVVSYALGGWTPPWGIEYRIDPLNALLLVIVSATTAVIAPYARRSVASEVPAERRHLFYAAMLLSLAGLLGIAATGDAFNAFVFLEISSLSSYILISLGPSPRALTAAFRYLVLGTIGATFILIGVGLLYMVTGTLNIVDLGARLAPLGTNRTVSVGLAFISVGIALKVALFPLHAWLPNAYAYAPSVVSAFLAANATKVALYLLFRFYFGVFGAAYGLEALPLETILLPLGLIAAFVASVVALFQIDLKRLLAYSSVAQVGYVVLGVGLANQAGLTGAIVHLFNHAITKGALFLAVGCLAYRGGRMTVAGLAGLGRRMPLTMAAFVVGALSLIGIPATAGFISKWYLVIGAIEAGLWPVAIAIVASSLLAVAYVWRVLEAAYLRPAPEPNAPRNETPASLLVPTWLLAGACIYFGIDGSRTVGAASEAAAFLMNLAR